MTISNSVNIDCMYQRQAPGKLICRAADTSGDTNETDEEICKQCEAGKIYRELGCEHISPQLVIYKSMTGKSWNIKNMRCTLRKRKTSYQYCLTCPYIGSQFTQPVIEEAQDFFERLGFSNAKRDLSTAKRKLAEGDNKGAITSAVAATESVFKSILDLLDAERPSKESIVPLWKAIRGKIRLGQDEEIIEEIKQVVGSVTRALSGLGSIRNDLSDAHGNGLVDKTVFNSYAELAVNLSAIISLFVIRRFQEETGGEQ